MTSPSSHEQSHPPPHAERLGTSCPARASAESEPERQRTSGLAGTVGPLTPEQVFREYAGRVYGVALRVVGNEADAEDVTQEVLLQVVRKLDTFRGDAALTTWLHRVTVNAALSLRRQQVARRALHVGGAGAARPVRAWPDEQALGRELRGLIEAAIAGLPPLYRAAYVLADVEGLANAEVATALGLSLPAVKSRLHRARLLMRAALAPHFEERAPATPCFGADRLGRPGMTCDPEGADTDV